MTSQKHDFTADDNVSHIVLTPSAKAAENINFKHREVQRLGRTAKEIAAEIGDDLIKVKAELKHGEFKPWVENNCSFSYRAARKYMQIAKSKWHDRAIFDLAVTLDEVIKAKPKIKPRQEKRAATLDDLRKVERLRALRDDLSATEGERRNAQAKLDEIESQIGKVTSAEVGQKPKTTGHAVSHKIACAIADRLSPILKPKVRASVIHALMTAYGDRPEQLSELLAELTQGR